MTSFALADAGYLPPQISVLVVTYQNAEEIEACLRSLLQSTSLPLQILIADNASTDGTLPLLKNFLEALEKTGHSCELHAQSENLGFTRALNVLLDRVRGEMVLFLNPDTSGWPRGGLERLARQLLDDPSIGVVAPQLVHADGSVQPSCRRFPTHRDLFFEMAGLSSIFPRSALFNRWKMGDFDHLRAHDVDQPQGACLLARREVVESVGRWDEKFPMFFSDVDWCRRVWAAGWRIRFVPETKVVHQQGVSVHKRRIAMIWTSHKSFFDYLAKYHRGWRGRVLNFVAAILLFAAAVARTIAYYLRSIIGV